MQEEYSRANRRGDTLTILVDHDRDALLTDFGKQTLADRYLLPGETPQTLFARVAVAYADDNEHAQRLYDYISRLWFMPATPVLSNGGTERGNPISCFLNSVEDSLEGIANVWDENIWLAARGGGIGTDWSKVRSIHERVGDVGKTSGIIPFIKVQDSLTLGISQGSLRRGSAAVYLDVSHPEIEAFIELRKPTGDHNRRALNIHHGITIPDAFMEAVENGDDWELVSPRDGTVRKVVSARALWQKILETRIATGEPYLLFIDTVNRAMPEHHKALGLKVSQSNLCSEITLPTGIDHIGNDRTAVCCLSSLNIDRFMEWQGNDQFLRDCLLFLDNVLEDFIQKTYGVRGFEKARYSAMRERSIGLGVMGFHSFLQRMDIPFESVMAGVWNKKIFSWLQATGDKINREVAAERGMCPDCEDAVNWGFDVPQVRWSNWMAIAPTASISIICGGVSAGIEPIPANSYTQKTLSGSFSVRNQRLDELLRKKGIELFAPSQGESGEGAADELKDWLADQWASITHHEGSVQHLPYFDDDEKAVFKTAFELDQRWLIQFMADRASYIGQAASNNIFLPATVDKRELHQVHFQSWKRGVKSLYYCRSKSVSRAESEASATNIAGEMPMPEQSVQPKNYEECLVCQ